MEKTGEPWVVGESKDRGRTLVVHAASPRLFVEFTPLAEDTWEVGEVTWLDPSPPTEDAGAWHEQAAEIFFRWAESKDPTYEDVGLLA